MRQRAARVHDLLCALPLGTTTHCLAPTTLRTAPTAPRAGGFWSRIKAKTINARGRRVVYHKYNYLNLSSIIILIMRL